MWNEEVLSFKNAAGALATPQLRRSLAGMAVAQWRQFRLKKTEDLETEDRRKEGGPSMAG
jgi:hypothetical protein